MGRIGKWRGFYVGASWRKAMLSCHYNGYGRGSQFALRVDNTWYGWWSDNGWSVEEQQPLKVTGPKLLAGRRSYVFRDVSERYMRMYEVELSSAVAEPPPAETQ